MRRATSQCVCQRVPLSASASDVPSAPLARQFHLPRCLAVVMTRRCKARMLHLLLVVKDSCRLKALGQHIGIAKGIDKNLGFLIGFLTTAPEHEVLEADHLGIAFHELVHNVGLVYLQTVNQMKEHKYVRIMITHTRLLWCKVRLFLGVSRCSTVTRVRNRQGGQKSTVR